MNLLFVAKYFKAITRPFGNHTILTGLMKYEGSNAQKQYAYYKKDSDYVDNIQAQKKKVNIDFLLRYANKTIRIREFLFGEPNGNTAVFPECQSDFPDQIWGMQPVMEFLDKQLEESTEPFQTEKEGLIHLITTQNESNLEAKIKKYYKSQGRSVKKIDVLEQVKNILRLPPAEYAEFLKIIKS